MKRKLLFAILPSALALTLAANLRAQDAPDSTDDNNPDQVIVPEGTEFKLQLHTTISSKASKKGDRVLTTLLDPVAVEDEDVLPKGLRVDGHIGEVKEARHRGKGGYLTIVFDTIELPSGEKLAIQGSLTEVFSTAGNGTAKVGPEGDLKGGGGSNRERIALVTAPTIAGAAAGGIGGGIAAAAGGILAAYLIPKGKQAQLEAGSLVGMRLDRYVVLTVAPANTQAAPAAGTAPATNPPAPPAKAPAADPPAPTR